VKRLRSCPVAGFGISGVESLESINQRSGRQSNKYKTEYEGKGINQNKLNLSNHITQCFIKISKHS
jgi:hypothetical protein